MFLSDIDIQKAIKNNEIQIQPFNPKMLKGGSYTFTLNNKIFIPKKQDLIDSRDINAELETQEIDENGYILNPGDFILAQTKETVSISTKLACILDARTSLARIGRNALQGSTFIEPGQSKSHEILEISNIGNSPIKIYPDMKIVKGIFVLLKTPAGQDYGKIGRYSKQDNAEVR